MGEVWVKLTEVSATGGEGKVIGVLDSGEMVAGDWQVYLQDLPEASRKVSDLQIVLIENLRSAGVVETVFNTRFFTVGDSREPELAGIWGAAVGSFWTMLVTILLAFPIGVMAAIYLEEFAKKNLMNTFIVDVPTGLTDSATVLPVQIYRWSDFPERAFEARTSAAILVFLVLMNGLAVFLRKRFERRW